MKRIEGNEQGDSLPSAGGDPHNGIHSPGHNPFNEGYSAFLVLPFNLHYRVSHRGVHGKCYVLNYFSTSA